MSLDDLLDAVDQGSFSRLHALPSISKSIVDLCHEHSICVIHRWIRTCLCRGTNGKDTIAGCVFLSMQGFSLHEVDDIGDNLLHVAGSFQSCPTDVIVFLIKAKIDPFALDRHGQLPQCWRIYKTLGLSKRLLPDLKLKELEKRTLRQDGEKKSP